MSGSLVPPTIAAMIHRAEDDFLSTGLALARPPRSVVFHRTDPETGLTTDLPAQAVVVRWRGDRGMRAFDAGTIATPLGASPTAMAGMFLAFEPFDVAVNDTFELDGLGGTIRVVLPAQNGRRRAGFVLETDARTAPES